MVDLVLSFKIQSVSFNQKEEITSADWMLSVLNQSINQSASRMTGCRFSEPFNQSASRLTGCWASRLNQSVSFTVDWLLSFKDRTISLTVDWVLDFQDSIRQLHARLTGCWVSKLRRCAAGVLPILHGTGGADDGLVGSDAEPAGILPLLRSWQRRWCHSGKRPSSTPLVSP